MSLDPRIQSLFEQQAKRGGIEIDKLAIGTVVEAKTKNSLYRIKALGGNRFEVKGGSYFPEPTEVTIPGSTWGGSMIKMNWLGIGMNIEFNPCTTTAVEALKIIAHDGSWEYDI